MLRYCSVCNTYLSEDEDCNNIPCFAEDSEDSLDEVSPDELEFLHRIVTEEELFHAGDL